jgi:hypothetical protein
MVDWFQIKQGDKMDEEIKQLLKDLHKELFDLVGNPMRIPCNCPPAEPIYDSRGKIVDAKPAFSCAFCRLEGVVGDIYNKESQGVS